MVLTEHGHDPALADAAAVPDAELLASGTNQEVAASFTEASDDQIRTIGYARHQALCAAHDHADWGNAAGNIPIAVVAVGRKRVAGATN